MLIWIDLNFARFIPAKAGREHEPELPAPRFGVRGSNAALSHQAQLIFGHRSLQSE
jgi:hypothetical protein